MLHALFYHMHFFKRLNSINIVLYQYSKENHWIKNEENMTHVHNNWF
jgi:hypothetical protein